MVRKLRDHAGHGGHTATGLALVGWNGIGEHSSPVTVELGEVPDDIAPGQFLAAMIKQVVIATPARHHVPVRELRERRPIALPEPDGATDDTPVVGGE